MTTGASSEGEFVQVAPGHGSTVKCWSSKFGIFFRNAGIEELWGFGSSRCSLKAFKKLSDTCVEVCCMRHFHDNCVVILNFICSDYPSPCVMGFVWKINPLPRTKSYLENHVYDGDLAGKKVIVFEEPLGFDEACSKMLPDLSRWFGKLSEHHPASVIAGSM